VKPTGQGLSLANGGGLLGQDEEGGLQGVLGVVGIPQGAPADAQDHRPVTAEQRLEGGLVMAAQEGPEQGAVGFLGYRLVGGQVPDVPDDCP